MTTALKSFQLGRANRAFIAAGAAAGPIYLLIGFGQATFRPGFDVTRHPLSLLANGHLGWVQTANFAIAGLLVLLGAWELNRIVTSRSEKAAAALLMFYGLTTISAAFFPADPGAGFPPGAPEIGAITLAGILHFGIGGLGFLAFTSAAVLLGKAAVARGEVGWGLCSILTGVLFLAAFVGIGAGAGNSATILSFYAAVVAGYAWVTALFIRTWSVSSSR